MNIFLLFACMMIVPLIAGRGVLGVIYYRQPIKFHMADDYIVGWLVTIGLAQAAHLAAAFLGWSISRVAVGWAAAMLGAVVPGVLLGVFLGRKKNPKSFTKREETTPLQVGLFIFFVLLMVWQIVTITSQESVYRTGDMTLETVESFLYTDGVYTVNPLTGRAYEAGIPLRIRILSLPTLYAMLCQIFKVESLHLVWRYIPVVVLLLSYGAFWLIGTTLLEGDKKREKRLLFMIMVAMVFCVGDYAYGMDGFGLLHCGFQGVTIRNTVLVPYAFSLALRQRWRPAVLLMLAEACIAWTFYGLGVCLVVFAGMALVHRWKSQKTAGLNRVKGEG